MIYGKKINFCILLSIIPIPFVEKAILFFCMFVKNVWVHFLIIKALISLEIRWC